MSSKTFWNSDEFMDAWSISLLGHHVMSRNRDLPTETSLGSGRFWRINIRFLFCVAFVLLSTEGAKSQHLYLPDSTSQLRICKQKAYAAYNINYIQIQWLLWNISLPQTMESVKSIKMRHLGLLFRLLVLTLNLRKKVGLLATTTNSNEVPGATTQGSTPCLRIFQMLLHLNLRDFNKKN